MRAYFEDQKWNSSVLCGDGPQLKYKSWIVFGGGGNMGGS